jgi:hypothetical protein
MNYEQIIKRLEEDKAASIAAQLIASDVSARIFERGKQAGLDMAITLLKSVRSE